MPTPWVIDAFSRKVVGWSIDNNMRTELVVDALGMAITHALPELVEGVLEEPKAATRAAPGNGNR